MLKHSIGATKDRFSDEHNDCSVVALANVMGIPYTESHERLRMKGRRRRHGTRFSIAVEALRQLKSEGKVTEIVERGDIVARYQSNMQFYSRLHFPTVAEYLRRLPKTGRFYLACTTHAFAYVDGVLYDNIEGGKMRARMKRAIEVRLPEIKTGERVSDLSKADIAAMWERLNKLEGKS